VESCVLNDPSASLGVLNLELLLTPSDVAIRNRGLQVLRESLPRLTDIVTFSLQSREPAYRRPPADLRLEEHGLRVITTCSLPADEWDGTTDWPRKLGHLRGIQGVPTRAMRRAYNIGAHVVFTAFMEWAVNEEELPHEHSVLLGRNVWSVYELYYAAAADGLRMAEEEIFGGRRAGELLDALLKGDADRDCVVGVMRTWEWAEQGRYVVVACQPAERNAPPVAQAELPAKAAGVRVVWRLYEGRALGVAALGDLPAATFAAALPARPGQRTGVSVVVDGLAELGKARRLAELAVLTAGNGSGVTCLEERLPAALLTAPMDVATELSTQVLAPVLALGRASQRRLLDTLAAWLAEGGSTLRASDVLFCDPRTVVNRLRRLERLTQRSLAAPKDLIELTLALGAVQTRTARS
jgi:hypothetical protein